MKTAVVFYADILGFKEMVSLARGAENDETFEKLNSAVHAIDEAMIDLQKNSTNEIAYKMFSDSFYLSVAYNENSAEDLNKATWFTFHIARLYQELMLMHQILIRGAISKGLDHNEKNFIFSPALIKAYTLENTQAIYPRIIIDDEIIFDLLKAKKQTTIFKGEEAEDHNKAIILDWSNVPFLNPFIILRILDGKRDDSYIETVLGYGLTMSALTEFLKAEQVRLMSLGKKKELDKNLWMERLFYWVAVEDESARPKSLIGFEYLKLSGK